MKGVGWGSILRGINGNVSFNVINFFYLNIHRPFLSHLVLTTGDYSLLLVVTNSNQQLSQATNNETHTAASYYSQL